MPGRGGKGTTWTPELERQMLILAISSSDLKPSMTTWNIVAQAMGNSITASAVSQKFSKLKKATETAASTAPSVTPSPTQPKQKAAPATTKQKRKAATTTDDDIDPMAKQSKQIKKEPNDGEELRGDYGGGANHGGVYHKAQEGFAMNGDAKGNDNRAEGAESDAADGNDDDHQNGVNTED